MSFYHRPTRRAPRQGPDGTDKYGQMPVPEIPVNRLIDPLARIISNYR
jgi:hypothetical protein